MSFQEGFDVIKEDWSMSSEDREMNEENKTLFQKYPFFSIGLFLAIAAVVFNLLGWEAVSILLFSSVPLIIVAKIFAWFFCFIGHPLTKFCIISLFVFIACIVVERALSLTEIPFIPINVVNIIGKIAVCLAAFGFLIRIFIIIFIKRL